MRRIITLLPLLSVLFLSGCLWIWIDKDKDDNTEFKERKDLEAVDLGLPSGVLWGSQNMGAQRPADLGTKYAWGETETKDEFSYNNYKDKDYTRYNYETPDGKYILDPDDDVANTELGGDWRMPTVWDYQELREYCTWEMRSGKNEGGYIVTSKVNGNKIFIPYYKVSYFLRWDDCTSQYWTSILEQKQDAYAARIGEDSGKEIYSVSPYDRALSALVRPVKGARTPAKSIALETPAIEFPGDSELLHVSFTPAGTLDRRLEWTSSNPDVVYVREDGMLVALFPGTATIKARATGSGFEKESTISIGAFRIPEKVDLGLPSGLLWSSFNLGSADQYDRGLQFSWGCTRPGIQFNTDIFTYHENYSWNGQNILVPEDDPAYVCLGPQWRTPTSADFQELMDNCDMAWADDDPATGCRFTSKSNGNSIFLPVAGLYSYFDSATAFFYWTSELSEPGFWGDAKVFYVNNLPDEPLPDFLVFGRYRGFCVRPVSDAGGY